MIKRFPTSRAQPNSTQLISIQYLADTVNGNCCIAHAHRAAAKVGVARRNNGSVRSAGAIPGSTATANS